MQGTFSILLARYPGDCVTVPFFTEEAIQILVDRVSEKLCTTLETGRIYIDGIEAWDYKLPVQHYRQLGSLFVYSNPNIPSPYKPIRNKELSKDNVDLFVHSESGKPFIVRIATTSTIFDLKAAICARQGIPEKAQLLVHSCKCLKDTDPISHYGICNNATINLSARLCGGQGPGPTIFADVADQAIACLGIFNQRAPPGRCAGVGTNVEATCKCTPSHRIVCNQGYGVYELGRTQSRCPLCNSAHVRPATAVFWACEYRTRGVKLNGEKHLSEWRRVGDGQQYEFFNSKKQSMWASLLIETKPLGHPDLCPICLERTTATTAVTTVTVAVAVTAGAAMAALIRELMSHGHSFHNSCVALLGKQVKFGSRKFAVE